MAERSCDLFLSGLPANTGFSESSLFQVAQLAANATLRALRITSRPALNSEFGFAHGGSMSALAIGHSLTLVEDR
jgi:hypothetical protein